MLENNLVNTQDKMAAIIAQNLLLQEQLAALNQIFVEGTEPSNQATVKGIVPMDATEPMSIRSGGGAWPPALSMGRGSVISFVDDTHNEVADIWGNSTSNGEMNDAGGLLLFIVAGATALLNMTRWMNPVSSILQQTYRQRHYRESGMDLLLIRVWRKMNQSGYMAEAILLPKHTPWTLG